MKANFNTYLISDNHFNHWNINRYCDRGFKSLDEMNNTMIKRWNAVVKPNDMVIHLGDIIFTKGESKRIIETLAKLNGRKILIKGNHDRKGYQFYMANGFDFVVERCIWRLNKKKILFIHDPKNITYNDYKTCNFVFHGHVHNKGQFVKTRKQCKIVNLSVEKINYRPINMTTLINRLQTGYYK